MQNRITVKQIAEKRLEEAIILFQNNLFDGACYLAGYSVELSLKVMISKTLDIDDLFVRRTEILKPFKTHDLDVLMIYSGLETRFLSDKATDIHLMNA
jgi:HEPN domain-containing protein